MRTTPLRLVLTIPVSVNDWVRVSRTGGIYKTVRAKEWACTAMWEAKVWRQKTGWHPTHHRKIVADYWIWWPDTRRHDPSNIEKVMWDALEGIVYDDDRWVLPRCQDFGVDERNRRVELEFWIKEVGR